MEVHLSSGAESGFGFSFVCFPFFLTSRNEIRAGVEFSVAVTAFRREGQWAGSHLLAWMQLTELSGRRASSLPSSAVPSPRPSPARGQRGERSLLPQGHSPAFPSSGVSPGMSPGCGALRGCPRQLPAVLRAPPSVCQQLPCCCLLGPLGWEDVTHRNVSFSESTKWHHSARVVRITSRWPSGNIW